MTALDPVLDNVSITRRPDAVSLDYHTCFTLGPRAVGDPSNGAVDRPWRIRYDPVSLGFYATGATDAGDSWGVETLVFTHTGAAFDEVDAAFDQQAHIVVVGQRAGHVWVYFYDPLGAAYTLVDFGLGRTPRVILDNPIDTSISDVLVFYLDDVADTMKYLQQRDRYLVARTCPVVGTANKYIEDVVRTTDYRVAVIYSVHDAMLGRYALGRLETTLYPVVIADGEDAFQPSTGFPTGSVLRTVLIAFDSSGLYVGAYPQLQDLDALTTLFSISYADLHSTLITLGVLYDVDELKTDFAIPATATLVVTVIVPITYTTYDNDALKNSSSIEATGSLRVVLITIATYDNDALKTDATIQATSTLV